MRWVDCKWLTHKFVQNLRSLINLTWIFSSLHGTNFFLTLKISHFNRLKQVYWLAKARQGQASFIFLVERPTIDTKNLKLKVIHSMDQFSPLNGFMLQFKFEPNTNFLENKILVVFCFLFLLYCNFNPTFIFFGIIIV